MKIRNGFVSNSSSSSFVLSLDGYSCTAEIASIMVPIRKWDDDKKLCNKFKKLADSNYDLPVAFRSCNYDTYISKESDGYYVFTCNNHSFYDVLNSKDREYDGDFYEVEEGIKNSTMYYWPEYDAFAQPVSYEEFEKRKCDSICRKQKCYVEIMRDKKGNLFCLKCKKIYLPCDEENENENS